MTLLLTYLLIAVAISFLCSLLEAILLSVPPSHIAVLIEQGSPAGERLKRMKDDVDRPLAAILTLNTFAHTLGAAGVGAQVVHLWGDAWLGAASFVLTLIILIFSEIIPKTLGAMHAKALAPFAALAIQILILLLSPLVAICNWFSNLFSRGDGREPRVSREEVSSLASIALEEGSINQHESNVIRNLIALRETTVEQIMTPRTVVDTLRADLTVREASEKGPSRFARIPLVGASLDEPKGVVHQRDLFAAVFQGKFETKLSDLARPMHAVPEVAKLPEVLEQFLQRREHLFLVVDEYGGSVGIVTLEDVLETLLGLEIMDETDSVADMQELAKQLVARRRKK